MLKMARRLFAVTMAVVMVLTLAVGASAAYISKTTTDGKMVGAAASDGACTVTVDIVGGDGNDKVIYFDLTGDAVTNEFWNNSSAYVELDVTLETDTSTISAIMPGCTSNWGWVSPATWGNALVYGKTVTIREDFMTYYNNGFSSQKPLQLRLQIISTATEMETVQISVSGLRFVGVDSAPAVTTTTAATTTTAEPVMTTPAEPVMTTPAEDADVDAPVEDETSAEDTPAEDVPPAEDETPAATTTSAATTKAPEKDDTSAVENTTAATTAATTTRAAANVKSDETSVVGMIVVIVIVAVVIIAGAVVGYIIYKKKKYY